MVGLLEQARAVSEAALATEGVYSLGVGRYAEAATYEGSEKVTGVVVSPEEIEVHIIADYPLAKPIPELSEKIRERVVERAEGRRVTVVVEDLRVVDDASF